MIIEIGLLLAAIALLLWSVQPSAEAKKYGNQIPGPESWPLVGNLFNVPLAGAESLIAQGHMIKKFGRVVKLWMGNLLVVLLFDPVDIEVLLKSNTLITKTIVYDFTIPWLGEGLLVSTGQKWRARRKAITPTFHFKVLGDFIEIFNRTGNILVERLSSKEGQGSFDVTPIITAYTLDIICETAMGIRIDAQAGNNKEYQEAVRKISILMGKRFNTPIIQNDWVYYLAGYKKQQDEYIKILKEHTLQVIQAKKKVLGSDSIKRDVEDINDLGMKKKSAFLELLLEMKNNANPTFQTDKDVQEEVDTFMFEGHDTTTSGICFALDHLAHNPECQEKLHEELRSKYTVGNCNPTMEELNDLKYLDMFIKEVQRISPSVPAIARQITEKLTLPSGYILPEGCMAVVNMFHAHRNPEWFPNPEVFDPDNFLPERVEKRHPFAFIPFSAGPRNCIGQKFAMLEMKSTLVKLVVNFKFERDPDFEVVHDSNIVLQAKNGHRIKITKREL